MPAESDNPCLVPSSGKRRIDTPESCPETYTCITACLCPPKHKINKLIKNQHQSDVLARGVRNSLLWLSRHCGSRLISPSTSGSPGASYAAAGNSGGWQSRCHCERGPIPMVGDGRDDIVSRSRGPEYWLQTTACLSRMT